MGEFLGMFQGLANGFDIAFTLTNLSFALIGAVLGTMVGILPGLGPSATISLLLPVSFKIGSPVTFSVGPIQSSSPIFKIVVTAEDLDLEEQEEQISKATQILTKDFVEVNKELDVE